MKTKRGRPPKNGKPVERVSISFSPEAWAMLSSVGDRKRSEVVSLCILNCADIIEVYGGKSSRNRKR